MNSFSLQSFSRPDDIQRTATMIELAEKREISIRETPRIEESDDETFWLNSGGVFYTQDGYTRTIFGELPAYSRWRITYGSSNPIDTDDGYHPQNVFRLITRQGERDMSQQLYFMITRDNLSTSPNRNESNGIFIIHRYMDANNLYYAGIRVDGAAIIKKKINGTYHTLATTPLFEGDRYDKHINPNLLPKSQWIGMRSDIENNPDGSVKIKLFVDKKGDGKWKMVLETRDAHTHETSIISGAGHGGIRSDFMDMRFRNYSLMAI